MSKKIPTCPGDLFVRISINSVIEGQIEDSIANPIPGKRFDAIFRLNDEVIVLDYQQEIMGAWLAEFLKKKIVEKHGVNSWGVNKKGEVRGINYFAQLFRAAMERFQKLYPKAFCPKGKDMNFTFEFQIVPDLDYRDDEHGGGPEWSAQSITFFPATKTYPAKKEATVHIVDILK